MRQMEVFSQGIITCRPDGDVPHTAAWHTKNGADIWIIPNWWLMVIPWGLKHNLTTRLKMEPRIELSFHCYIGFCNSQTHFYINNICRNEKP